MLAAASLAAAALGESGTLTGAQNDGSDPTALTQQSSAEYFNPTALYERMKVYAQHGGIPMEYVERYVNQRGPHSLSSSHDPSNDQNRLN